MSSFFILLIRFELPKKIDFQTGYYLALIKNEVVVIWPKSVPYLAFSYTYMHIQGSWGFALMGKPPHSPKILKSFEIKIIINWFNKKMKLLQIKRNCFKKTKETVSKKQKKLFSKKWAATIRNNCFKKSKYNCPTPTRTKRMREMATIFAFATNGIAFYK